MKRSSMEFVKQKFENQPIVGAEVGVQQGYNALDILQNIPNIELLYLIDPYLGLTPYDGNEGIKKLAKENLKPFNEKIQWVYKEFEICTIQDIPSPLHFIYIDGNHLYEYVKQDILLAIQFVMKGGVIAGHDAGASGVDKARLEYCESKKITQYIGKNLPVVNGKPVEEGWDWWFINI